MKQDTAFTRRASFRLALAASAMLVMTGCLERPATNNLAVPTGLAVYLAQQSPDPGLQPVLSSGIKLYRRREPLVTSADTSLVRVLTTPFGDYRVVVQLKDGAPDHLAPLLRDHRGDLLAILIDGQLVATQIIDEPLGGRLTIANKFSKERAEAIARAI